MGKNGLYEYVHDFSTDCGSTAVDDTSDIHKYFMKTWYVKVLRLIKPIFLALLNFSRYLATKCL